MKILAAIAAFMMTLTGFAAPAIGQGYVVQKRTAEGAGEARRSHHRRVTHRRTYVRRHVARARTYCSVRYRYHQRYRICRTVYRR